MGDWKNRDRKVTKRRQLREQKKFYGENISDKKRRGKESIREQRQEKELEYDQTLDA